MRSSRLASGFFKKNRYKLAEGLPPKSLAIICSNHRMPRNGDQYFPYRQNSDLYYLTGIEQEETILFMVPDHPDPAHRELLMILKPTPKMEIWEGHKLTTAEASEISGIKKVEWIDDFDEIFSNTIQSIEIIYFNFPENPKFSPRVKPYDHLISERIESLFPGFSRGRLAPLFTKLRMIKEEEEIETIKQACRITGNAFNRALRFVKPGVMEYEVEAELTHEFIRSGAEGHAYDPIIASGKNAITLHYIENNSVCKNGELLLMDFGAEYKNYAADCTRTIPVNGQFTKRQKEIYDATLRVLRNAIKLMTPGKKMDDFHAEVGLLWQEEHIRLGLYSAEDVEGQDPENPKWKTYYVHGTSHPIGLDVHDPFDRTIPFASGMVMSCEPAIYIPEEDLGIRLENTILISEEGPVDLMEDIPLESDDIERFMR